MGQHKTNPTAIAAKEGKIPPKPKKKGKRERDRLLYAKCQEIIYRSVGYNDDSSGATYRSCHRSSANI